MSEIQNLTVALGERSYPILIGQKIVPEILRERLQKYIDVRRPIAIVTCPALVRLHAEIFEELRGIAKTIFVTSVDGETAKSTAELVALWENLARERIDRSGVIVAIGGGVVGDLAGFAAGTFLRGIDFIQVPTTLLAMVDSSVGGKTAVNLEAGKNLVGLFYQPQAVLADMNLLATLPQNEFAAGVGEVIKYGMLGDAQLFEQLEAAGTLSAGTPILPAIIQRCCEIKAQVVAADERETAAENGRALLNLGHTFAHAIEKVAGYGAYLHGEAVAIGLVAAAKLSEKLGVCGNEICGNTCGSEICGNEESRLGNGDNPVADSKILQKVDLNSGDKIVAVPKPLHGNAESRLGNGDNPVADSKILQKVDLNSGDKIVAVPEPLHGNAESRLGNGDNPVADSKILQKVDLNSGDKIVAVPEPLHGNAASRLGNGDNPVADSKILQKVDLNSGDKIVAVPKPLHGNAASRLGNGDNPVADSKILQKVELNSGDKIVAVPAKLSARVEKLLLTNNLPTKLRAPLDVPALMAAMASDKKVAAGTLKFVLLRSLGNAFTTKDVPAADVEEIWRELNS